MHYFGMFITTVCLLFLINVHFICHLNIDITVCFPLLVMKNILHVSLEQTFLTRQRRKKEEKKEQDVRQKEEERKKKNLQVFCAV